MPKALAELVASNVMRIVRERAGDPNLPRASVETRLRQLGLANGTAQRLFAGADLRLSTIEDVARALRVTPLQLIASDAPASAVPDWPLQEVGYAEWEALTERQRGAVDRVVRMEVDRLIARGQSGGDPVISPTQPRTGTAG